MHWYAPLLMVASRKRGWSVGSPALEHRRDCAEKNLAVEPQGPVVDVELVELLLQLDIRIASFGYLPEACQPGVTERRLSRNSLSIAER